METLNLKDLEKAAEAFRDIERVIDKISAITPALRLLKELGDTASVLPADDRLLRSGDAAKLLGVSQATITSFVKAKLLTPMYVNSDQRRFWLSEVKALAKKQPLVRRGLRRLS